MENKPNFSWFNITIKNAAIWRGTVQKCLIVHDFSPKSDVWRSTKSCRYSDHYLHSNLPQAAGPKQNAKRSSLDRLTFVSSRRTVGWAQKIEHSFVAFLQLIRNQEICCRNRIVVAKPASHSNPSSVLFCGSLLKDGQRMDATLHVLRLHRWFATILGCPYSFSFDEELKSGANNCEWHFAEYYLGRNVWKTNRM